VDRCGDPCRRLGNRKSSSLSPARSIPSYRFAGLLGDLELNRALGLPLHDNGASGDAFAVCDVTHLESYQVTGSELAVDRQVEQGKVADAVGDLKAHPDGPDVFELEGRLLPDQLALVPGLAVQHAGGRLVHDSAPFGLKGTKHCNPPTSGACRP